ncbi:MAG: tetratricopeptide repeat protein [Pyrinomonadaceae bacterium]
MSFENVPNFLLNFFEAEMISGNETTSYRFNSFLLDVAERQLIRDRKPISLTPKAFDVLVYLVARRGHLVLKDELMQAVWPDSFVDEVNLPRTVHTIRATLGEDNNGNKFIETVPTKGYRFVARVEEVDGNGLGLPRQEGVFGPLDRRFGNFADSIQLQAIEAGKKETRAGRPRPVFIIAFAIILVVLVTGSWLAYRSEMKTTDLRASAVQTKNGEAYQFYQQGKILIERGRWQDNDDALTSFERAIELDPTFVAAYVGKADAKIRIFWGSGGHDDISQARAAINKAVELDRSNSYAHTLLCRIRGTYDWDFDEAEKECRRALELDPNDHEAHREMAFFLSSFGREGEALSEIDAAIELAPTSFNKRSRGVILYYARRYDEAIEQLRQVEETDPNAPDARRWLMNAYEMKKDYTQALGARIRQIEHHGATSDEVASVRAAFNESGWPGVLKNMVDPNNPATVGLPAVATTYAQLGDNDKAFESLERMFDGRSIMLIHCAREPRFDPIRSDPRFELLLKRIGLGR